MDNWLFNNTDQADDNHPLNTSPNIDNSNLLFIDYVTNLRGFNYSAQYGHNYFLYNGELRLPIIKYLVRRQITSNFLRNFQVVGFYDFGVAWSGKSPFTLENDINNQIIDIGSFKANVTNYRNPFIYGYGFGFRSMIWGYYAKLDFAWGVQDYVRQNLKVYLSIGYDF
jgi:outer membrane translocation and assembly module TamA